MAPSALGIRVKSGWASAVLVRVEEGAPRIVHRARLELADPAVPKSSQPYHRGTGRLQKDAAIIARLSDVVHAAATRSIAALFEDCKGRGCAPATVALVVGSTIDPESVTNEHIRAHAYEARLFRTALEQAAGSLRLECSVTRERDLGAVVAKTLGPAATDMVASLGRVAGRPWRADEKLATLAAWVASVSSSPRAVVVQRTPDRTIEWLLRGDPAIQWQALRDLVEDGDGKGDPRRVERARKAVAREGWGARLLQRQRANGIWAAGKAPDSGLYGPKWISTTYTMLLLRDMGLAPNHPKMRKPCRVLLDRGLRPDGGIDYGRWAQWTKRGETCVTGMVLSLLSYFECDDPRLETIADHLLEQQMPDGGWNCRRSEGATHSSMHTTISVLEGLHQYGLHRGGDVRKARTAQARGREFLLAHRLFRSHRTGEIIKTEFTRFVFPPRWHYDVLRALDHFRGVDAPRDERLAEAIEMVRGRRGADGRWVLEKRYPGKVWFEMERVGEPSRWNTLRALRVLKWWDAR